MEWFRRRRLVAASILTVGLALLGWHLLPDDSQRPTPATSQVTTSPSPATEGQSSAPSADVPSAAVEPGRANAGALHGRAFDAITGEPVRKFEITWRELAGKPRQQFNSRRQTFETADGRFEYPDVPPGKWTLIVRARGYQRFELPDLIVTGEAGQELELPLQKGYTLRGRVYDQTTGAGVAASIDVLDPLTPLSMRSPGQGTAQAVTQDGSFVIGDLSPGRAALAVEAKNYTGRTVLVEVGANTPSLEIGLAAGARIAGRLTNAAGTPIAEGSVKLYRAEGGLAGTSSTDAEGKFEFRDLEAGKYQLAGKHGSAMVTEDVTLSGGTANVQLVLAAGHAIRGTITGLRPELFDRVNITVRRAGQVVSTQNRVNERGEFELNDVAPGPITVAADVNRTREVSKSLDMPADADATVTLDFAPGAALSGRISRNNQPLSDLLVIVRPPNPSNSANSHSTKTSNTGAYAVHDLEPGEYAVTVGSFISRPLQVQGQVVFDIDMPGGDLIGRVLDDSTGLPLAGASVDLYFADLTASNLRINRFSDHLGQFAIDGVVPTEYLLTAYRPGYRLYRERISFDAQTAAQVIRLRPERGVEIRGRDATTGRPVREIMVIETIAGRGGFQIDVALDEDGIGYLPSGLTGSKLNLVAPGVGYVTIPSWNGAALDLRFGERAIHR